MSGEEPKYMGLPGETRPFNIRAIHEARNEISITEGEIDAITLEMCGLPAVGITGASNWKRHHWRMFSGFDRVYVFGDGDAAGREFTRKVTDSILSGVGISLGDGEDVNSVYIRGGRDAVMELIV
jgi:DNA primase